MKNKKWVLIYFLLILSVATVPSGMRKYERWREARSGIPDLVSDMSINNRHCLVMIVNESRIDNKERFAREAIHMCQENSFHSIRFSTDVNGYPSSLDITVYLKRKDVGEEPPVCKIRFCTDNFSMDYDIKHDADKFRLYLDGEEISFF